MNIDSPDIPQHEYVKAMLLALAFNKPKKVTILGLGGGAIPRALKKSICVREMKVVELREKVVKMCKLHFGLPSYPPCRIFVQDARDYLSNKRNSSTDMLFADLFHHYGMDFYQSSESFIRESARVLKKDGWLVTNMHSAPEQRSNFINALQSNFNEVLICEVPSGNYVVYAGKRKLLYPIKYYLQDLELTTISQIGEVGKLQNSISYFASSQVSH